MSVDTKEIKININPLKKTRLSMKSPKSRWKTVSHHVQDISHWKNSETTTQCFSGKASFRYLDVSGNLKTRGETININQNETIVELVFGKNVSNNCLKFAHKKTKYLINILNLLVSIIGLCILSDFIPIDYSIYIGLLWLLIPLHVLSISNRLVMKRMWRNSFLPWMQVYISSTETWAFCDLCSWDSRTWIIGPPLILSQLTIINYDAVYFKKENKKLIIMHIITALLWKLCLLLGVRLDYFPNINDRQILLLKTEPNNLYLDNLSLYVSKTMSMMLFLFGQLYFRFKHKDKAYAIRTNYTIKSNKEWMNIQRTIRINKKENLEKNVESTKLFLKNKK